MYITAIIYLFNLFKLNKFMHLIYVNICIYKYIYLIYLVMPVSSVKVNTKNIFPVYLLHYIIIIVLKSSFQIQ